MEFRSLEIFVAVVNQRGFSAAADRVFLTQPSISRLIRQLEEDAGNPLLTRNRRGVSLTDAGKIVYQRAVTLIAEQNRLKKELAALAGLESGQLNLGIPPLGGVLFVPLVRKFKEFYPGIDLRLFEKGSRATESDILAGHLDVGTLLLPNDNPDFESVPFLVDRLVLAVPRSEKWASRKPVSLEALRKEPMILFPQEFALNEQILGACRKAGFEPQIAGRSGQAQFIEGLVESGVGVALLPYSVTRRFTTVKTRELEKPGILWKIGLAWLRESYLSHAAKALIAIATDPAVPDPVVADISVPEKTPPPRYNDSPWLSRPPSIPGFPER